MMNGTFRKIVALERYTPDNKHDTRHLECGHQVVVPRARLHPMRGHCKECETQANP